MDLRVNKDFRCLSGEVKIPADKSISHRSVIFGSLSKGKSIIRNFSSGADPQSSIEVCRSLGAEIEQNGGNVIIKHPLNTISENYRLYCGNSGTTMRLMTGVLAGQKFNSELTGDESLSMRPMRRIIEPLSLMGANITSVDFHSPLKITGSPLHGINYTSPISSAQVKSCILLAGLFADGSTTYKEINPTRNHTELMLKSMGADIILNGNETTIQKSELNPLDIEIFGDISSAAYFIVAGLIIPNSKIIIKNIGLNPTRSGIIKIAKQMGGKIEILDIRETAGETVGDVRVEYTQNLRPCEISGEVIPTLIDELPIIALMATQADGQTIIKDAQDLRNKESDRITTTVKELKKLGADIEETPDGMIIQGKSNLTGDTEVNSYKDHRLAMTLYVAGLITKKEISIKDFDWVKISFPEFEKLMNSLKK